MNNLQAEIYNTWRLWNKDKKNTSFYDTYVSLCCDDYPEQRDYYLKYWESLKKESWRIGYKIEEKRGEKK
jgi:hypothetical protein